MKRVLITLAIIIALFPVGIAQGWAVRKTTVEKGAMPAEFGKEGEVLLCVLAERKSFDKYLIKNTKKNYFGKHEFVTKSELKSEKYADKDKYRYYFSHRKIGSYVGTTQGPPRYVVGTHCFIVDRITNKEYDNDFITGSFAKLIKGYMKNLEKTRLSNQ